MNREWQYGPAKIKNKMQNISNWKIIFFYGWTTYSIQPDVELKLFVICYSQIKFATRSAEFRF